MINERAIEVPWALAQLPQFGSVLDIGSCDAAYLPAIVQPHRHLHCLDPRDCGATVPPGAVFHHQSVIGNTLPSSFYDAILALSTVEHIGLPCYGQKPFARGDYLAMVEFRDLLKPGGRLIMTVPAGSSKITSWYRQYSPAALRDLLDGWAATICFWAFNGSEYIPIAEERVTEFDYRDRFEHEAGAGAVAGVIASLL